MDKKFEWPTREEWAKRQRTVYGDMLEDLISTRLSDYASADEVAAAIAALRKLWCAYGQRMKEAKRNAGDVIDRNYYDLNEEERKLIAPIHTCQDRRKTINQVIKFFREGQYHYYVNWVLDRDACPPLAMIKERYDAAWTAAELKVRQRVAATPIDDAAWARELEIRRSTDAYFNDPTANIYRSNIKEKAE
jgi:hypothetical protein